MEPRDHGVEPEADVRPRSRLTRAAEIGTSETRNRESRRQDNPAFRDRSSGERTTWPHPIPLTRKASVRHEFRSELTS